MMNNYTCSGKHHRSGPWWPWGEASRDRCRRRPWGRPRWPRRSERGVAEAPSGAPSRARRCCGGGRKRGRAQKRRSIGLGSGPEGWRRWAGRAPCRQLWPPSMSPIVAEPSSSLVVAAAAAHCVCLSVRCVSERKLQKRVRFLWYHHHSEVQKCIFKIIISLNYQLVN